MGGTRGYDEGGENSSQDLDEAIISKERVDQSVGRWKIYAAVLEIFDSRKYRRSRQ